MRRYVHETVVSTPPEALFPEGGTRVRLTQEVSLRGVEGGFAQLCHGKRLPLEKMSVGDWLVYYSPRTEMRGGEPLREFTALGRVHGARTVHEGGGSTSSGATPTGACWLAARKGVRRFVGGNVSARVL
jgi:hypothetical protein